MVQKVIDLCSIKCPLPVLRTRKALAASEPGDLLIVSCTDPLSGIDIPHLLNETGDVLEATHSEARLITFWIRKR